jgi:hypothetical protein
MWDVGTDPTINTVNWSRKVIRAPKELLRRVFDARSSLHELYCDYVNGLDQRLIYQSWFMGLADPE